MLVKVFLLLVSLSTAYAITCYYCIGTDCSQSLNCGGDPTLDRCMSEKTAGQTSKSCASKVQCGRLVNKDSYCCTTDLCNGSAPTGPTVLLLLAASSVIFTLFL
ncbi:hypothetical protein WMY93_013154 [Mugilogobius chulae]|uniref:UPAR/Ly6 domain-containing protein n=1 Tax=Mugilogobius chulae TaxID=88201 RepID=A0AAW0NZ75_9GOBI